MAEWTKICCPVDFSEPARLAMDSACDVARRWGGELTLLHVYTSNAAGEGTGASPRSLRDAEAKLASWRSEAEFLADRRVGSAMVEGQPAAEILRFAREGQFQLIVMGTHGLTGLRRLVLGSVAERVLHQASCSVLVIRPMARLDPH